MSDRDAELRRSLDAVRRRINEAAAVAGRDPGEVTLIAVTKTYPAGDVAALARIGVGDVGESKDQEARAKLADLADANATGPLRWHVVGRLQTNKSRSVASYAHAVHSVDRVKLARSLAEASSDRDEPLEVFVQVSLDEDRDRGGVVPAELDRVVDAVAERDELRLRGLMAVPPIDADADAAYAELARLAAGVRAAHPGADGLSAGMSGDLEAAIRNGSTHVRVGTALLGRRQQLFS